MKDRQTFKEFMAGLGEVFDKEVTPTLSAIYWKALEPFSDEDCEQAFNQIIARSKFFPKPADFLEILEPGQEDRALLALTEVEKAVRSHGPYASVKFQDPVIHSVIDSLGGWAAFQDCTEKEFIWRKKDFLSRYRAMRTKKDHPEYLPGQMEIDNGARGFVDHIPRPVLIGRPSRPRIEAPKTAPKLAEKVTAIGGGRG